MKKYITMVLLLFAGLILGPDAMMAQANRTLETKVVDVLAQLPTADQEHADRLCREVLEMGEVGIREFTARLVPAEQGNDSQARYLLHSLAVYSGGQSGSIDQANMVENAYIEAIKEAQDDEVRTFLIRRLAFCGSNTSVKFLAPYLDQDNALFEPSLSVIMNIHTEDSAASVLRAARGAEGSRMFDLMQALGELQYPKANAYLTEKANNREPMIQLYALRSLAEIGSKESYNTLFKAAKNAGFKMDIRGASLSYLEFGRVIHARGNVELATEVAEQVLQNCTAADQIHLRSGGVQLLAAVQGAEANEVLVREVANNDREYRGTVLEAADAFLGPEQYGAWIKACNSASPEAKPQIVSMLGKRQDADIFEKCLLPAMNGSDPAVRIAAIKTMDYQDKEKAIAALQASLQQKGSKEEYQAIQETLLRICDREDASRLATDLSGMSDEGRIVVVNVLSERRVDSEFSKVTGLLGKGSAELDEAIYASLHNLAGEEDIAQLLGMLETAPKSQTAKVQQALVQVLDQSKTDHSGQVFSAYASSKNKERLLPVFVAVGNEKSLELVATALDSGSPEAQAIAVETLGDWRNDAAIPHLFRAASSPGKQTVHSRAYYNYLEQVVGSSHPDDQKLLLVKKILPYNRSDQEKQWVIRAAGEIRTFLSLVFVSEFLNEPELVNIASNTAIRIALPTPESEGMYGTVVRDIVSRSVGNLSGQDSEYLRIDVKEFLDNMPKDKGFLPIFNGKDLSGWQGLVEDPLKRSKMTASQLQQKQAEADAQMAKEWLVANASLQFVGDGFQNICTVKKYGDFEMIVEWRIQEGGDTGIYLRGTPQVQIWDTALLDKGAEVGSGGLYNNESNPSKPLLVADNPIKEWNTFRIRMVGDLVTVHLNGHLVTDGVVLENYWNRQLPLPVKEAIELQAHQELVEFRNVYVRELDQGGYALSEEEKNAGFVALFNGKDLDQWEGNKRDYLVEGGDLVVRPEQGDHGNLYTQNDYSDFILRFEFQLTEGANNGLGIHAPTEGDVAYVGKEIQILDNTAEIYANLEEWQYHGSVYGIIKAKRGFLKPVGEWNYEEVVVQGDDIRVTLNGTVILEGNMKEAAANGTLDGKEHPGLQRNSGRIAFLGHGSELRFRNIRVKELSK